MSMSPRENYIAAIRFGQPEYVPLGSIGVSVLDPVQARANNLADMEAEAKAKLDIGMAGPGGYVFHSDHSIPTQVSFARYGRIAQLVREYGVYG